jgi:predicted small integral membrane protein
MIERLSKILLVASVALVMGLATFNNLTDYGSNFDFVKHVLSMDTTFPGNTLKWRALTSPVVHHVFYATIIAWEAVTFLGLVLGTWKLWSARGSAAAFAAAKPMVVGVLTLNLALWFIAFLTVGGEWYVMWQSQIWNGQAAAFRMFTCIGIILLFLKTPETDPDAVP